MARARKAARRGGNAFGAIRVIVNADDYGRSLSINEAVIRAHQEGILTSASLMVTGAAFEEAVTAAKKVPSMGVGLHLTLVQGRTALDSHRIPGIARADGEFDSSPVRAGLRYYFFPRLREELFLEIEAQVERFRSTGLPLDHVNGHLNLHLHPVVLRILERNAERWGIRAIRLTRDPFLLNARLSNGRWVYRSSHALMFSLLSGWARPRLKRGGIRQVDAVFGLLQTGRVGECYLNALLERLPCGTFEVYSHPSLDEFREEFEALISTKTKQSIERLGIERIRYQDL